MRLFLSKMAKDRTRELSSLTSPCLSLAFTLILVLIVLAFLLVLVLILIIIFLLARFGFRDGPCNCRGSPPASGAPFKVVFTISESGVPFGHDSWIHQRQVRTHLRPLHPRG